MARSEGNMSLKNPVTPPGIDPGTVRLVGQRLNHYATPCRRTAVKEEFKRVDYRLALLSCPLARQLSRRVQVL